jgi:hypothetical protein
LVPLLKTLKIKNFWAILLVLTGAGAIAGGALLRYPWAICIKKNPQIEECTVLRRFFITVVGHEILYCPPSLVRNPRKLKGKQHTIILDGKRLLPLLRKIQARTYQL